MRIALQCASCFWHYTLSMHDIEDYDPAEYDVCPVCGGKTRATVINQGAVR